MGIAACFMRFIAGALQRGCGKQGGNMGAAMKDGVFRMGCCGGKKA